MNKRNKARWLKALKSGKYRQIKHYLYTRDDSDGIPQMCCLGVALDVLVEGEWKSIYDNGHSFKDDQYLDCVMHAPLLATQHKIKLTDKALNDLVAINDHSDNYDKAIEYIEQFL